ncbi:aldehyde dehydrogenase family protein [Streptomyces sp. NBC_01754]|uniref:aldehyde dehydrogenase family protein n=1 Tax=Streptomyces sp. NBC_01754 TaxID=2975930 RepID=UPI002DDBEB5D|nr:aldehyde dehydrogenase family protein [Streptomyces sp. NBC_01754]WSC96221.1 aldehyde dehydrogenase family protein [Streptomyces sp. NBC_01754]
METLLGGQWVAADAWLRVHDPADTRTPVVRVPALGAPDVARAYDEAERGFEVWRRTSPFERARVFHETARLLRERAADIAADVVTENGKNAAEAGGEVQKAADFFEYYAGAARSGYGTLLHDARPDTRTSSESVPVGIVLAVTPWNDPLLTPARKLAPALAAGNAVVLKPASETPMSALHLARALHDAGLPAGVLGVVTGRGRDLSAPLLDDPRLAAVTFTGSNSVGEGLRASLADRNVRFQGELGGKNATVVLADADLPAAVTALMTAAFGQTGQRCTATSRVLVERSVYEEFTGLLLDAVSALRPGPGSSGPGVVGPLVSTGQRRAVLADIERAVGEGATVLAGGGTPSGEALAHGCYVDPTVLGDVTREMAVWREEVFGPVLVLRPVDGFEEAVDEVNDSGFGLAAALFTRDLRAAHRFAREADCGQVAVNTTTSGWDVHHPFGGFRDSGSAFKEQGTEALRFYTRVKTVAFHFGT